MKGIGFLVLCSALIFLASTVYAQRSGSITGLFIDTFNDEPLAFANLSVAGTTLTVNTAVLSSGICFVNLYDNNISGYSEDAEEVMRLFLQFSS